MAAEMLLKHTAFFKDAVSFPENPIVKSPTPSLFILKCCRTFRLLLKRSIERSPMYAISLTLTLIH